MPIGTSKRRNLPARSESVRDFPIGTEVEYYGAIVRGTKTGPRRELTLLLETWPKGKTAFGSGDLVAIRFGSIANYETVQKYFTKIPGDSLHYLRELKESTARRRVIEMEFDRTGDRIIILAGKVSKPARESTRPT